MKVKSRRQKRKWASKIVLCALIAVSGLGCTPDCPPPNKKPEATMPPVPPNKPQSTTEQIDISPKTAVHSQKIPAVLPALSLDTLLGSYQLLFQNEDGTPLKKKKIRTGCFAQITPTDGGGLKFDACHRSKWHNLIKPQSITTDAWTVEGFDVGWYIDNANRSKVYTIKKPTVTFMRGPNNPKQFLAIETFEVTGRNLFGRKRRINKDYKLRIKLVLTKVGPPTLTTVAPKQLRPGIYSVQLAESFNRESPGITIPVCDIKLKPNYITDVEYAVPPDRPLVAIPSTDTPCIKGYLRDRQPGIIELDISYQNKSKNNPLSLVGRFKAKQTNATPLTYKAEPRLSHLPDYEKGVYYTFTLTRKKLTKKHGLIIKDDDGMKKRK